MNIHDIQRCFTLVCAAGGIACIAAILLYAARHQLRQLVDRWLALGRLGQCVSLLMLTVFVLYGGTKPVTNEVEIVGGGGQSNLTSCAFGLEEGMTLHCPPPPLLSTLSVTPPLRSTSPSGQQLNMIPNWTARGAYGDWQRIDFPDGFAFPLGTNLLSGVTLMSWGELRCNDGALAVEPHQSATTGASSLRIVSLPSPVSLEPGVSACAYGLTSSNSCIFAWQNVCVNRDATNRVDAAIELFASGAILITTQPTNQPTSKQANHLPPRPPEGFVGEGQDDAWALAAFPADYAAITNKGYEAWLMEDKVGINEQNGLYKVSITVSSLPSGDMPCYLVCGPYKVVVNSPGTYSFPLEVLEHYTARTYPVAVPLSIDYDDGYRGEEPDPRLLRMSPQRQLLGVPLIFPPIYDIWQEPRLVISPTEIPLETAVGTHISIWCNVASTVRRYSALISREFRLNFCNPSDAEIIAAEVEDLVEIIVDAPLGTYAGTITITDLHSCCGCGSCSGDDCSCGCDCWRHRPSTDTPTNTPSATP